MTVELSLMFIWETGVSNNYLPDAVFATGNAFRGQTKLKTAQSYSMCLLHVIKKHFRNDIRLKTSCLDKNDSC